MSKSIISDIPNREVFFHLLEHNPGIIVLKLGAEWCGPCKKIKNVVHAFFATSPAEVVCGDIDVSITGSHPEDIHKFFLRCGNHLTTALKNNPK